MPIQLTTPIQTGDLAPDGPYQQAKIHSFTVFPTDKIIDLAVQYGNTTGGVFVKGPDIEGVTIKRHRITGADYDTLVASTSAAAGEVYYSKVAERLYQYMIDQGWYAGTIV